MQVTVYSTPTCPYCRQVKAYLQARGVAFRDVDVSEDAAAAEEMVRISGQQGVPVIQIDDQIVVGFDQPRLEALLGRTKPEGLGALVADAAEMAARGRTDQASGAYVGRVRPGSAAAMAGLEAGDVIVALAGHPVRSVAGLETLIARLPKGHEAPLEYVRDGRRFSAKLMR